MPRIISIFPTGYTKIQHDKSKAKTVQLCFFVYAKFHYQLKETFMITLLSKFIPWDNFVGVDHKFSTLLGVGRQNASDGGQGQVTLQPKPKRRNTGTENRTLQLKSNSWVQSLTSSLTSHMLMKKSCNLSKPLFHSLVKW